MTTLCNRYVGQWKPKITCNHFKDKLYRILLEHYCNCVGKSSKLVRAQIDIDVSALVKCIHMLPGVRGDGQSLLPNISHGSTLSFQICRYELRCEYTLLG